MNKSRAASPGVHSPREKSKAFSVAALTALAVPAVVLLADSGGHGGTAPNVPLHLVLELLGGLVAAAMAAFLISARNRSQSRFFFPLGMGFLHMGVLDIFHALAPAGNAFVFLHSFAVFTGGAWFAALRLPSSWFNEKKSVKKLAPWCTLVFTVPVGIIALAAPSVIPLMVSNGAFTSAATVLNCAGGVFFVLAAVSLICCANTGIGNLRVLFIAISLLFGAAGLLFSISQLWDIQWWTWHGIRFVSYILCLLFLARAYSSATRMFYSTHAPETAACLVALTALTVLFGWGFDIPGLKSVMPGMVSMKANTAICFLLIALALGLRRMPRLHAAVPAATAGLAVSIATLTLAEYIFGVNFGIDELLFADNTAAVATSHPGRMAPNTAACFILLGGSLLALFSHIPGLARIATVVSPVPGLLGLLAVVGYATGTGSYYTFSRLTAMALHTALLMIVASAGITAISNPPSGPRDKVVERKIFWGFVGAFCGILLLGVLAFRINTNMTESLEQSGTTDATILHLEELASVMKDAETGARGFALTGNEQFLQPFRSAQAQAHRVTAQACSLAVDDTLLLASLRGLGELVDRRLAVADRVVKARRREGLQAAVHAVDSGEGKTVMDSIRALVYDLKGRQTATSLKQRRALEGNVRTVQTATYLMVVSLALGMLLLYRSIARNFMAQRRALQAAEQSKTFTESIVDTIREPLVVLDLDLKVISANRSYHTQFDIQPDAVLNRHLYEIGNGQWDIPHLRSLLRGCVTDNRPFRDFEVEREFDRIGTRTMLLNGRKIFRPGNNTHMVLLAIEDITERKKAEADLRESEEKFRLFFELSADLVCIADLNGYFTMLNSSWENVLGYSRQELQSRPFFDFIHPDDKEKTVQVVKEKLERGETVHSFENRYMRKDGGWVWLEWVSRPLVEKHCTFAVARDVSARKQSQEAIADLNTSLEAKAEELEAVNKELESFAYSVSHDLRVPLRAIDGFSRILQEDYAEKLDTEGMRLFDVVRENTAKMAQLIDDLLSFSRLGRAEISTRRIDMTTLARSVYQEALAATPDRTIRFELEDLPPIQGDYSMVKQVFANLVGNAVKFTRGKQDALVEIGATRADGEIVYHVRDNGAGFDMQYRNKLFGIFQRLHLQSEFEGTGVGLSLVQRIIHRHGGRVWGEGKVGEGATFRFSLPA